MVWKGVREAAPRAPEEILHVSPAHDPRLSQYNNSNHHGPTTTCLEQTLKSGIMMSSKQPARRPLSLVTRPVMALFGAKTHQEKSYTSPAPTGTDAAYSLSIVAVPTTPAQQLISDTSPQCTSGFSTTSVKSASDTNISYGWRLRLSSSIRRSFRHRWSPSSGGALSSDAQRRNCKVTFADSGRPHPEREASPGSVGHFQYGSSDSVEVVGSAYRCHWHSSYKHATFAEKRKCFDAREATMLLRNRHAVRRTAGHVDEHGRRRSVDSLTVSFDSVSVTGPRPHWAIKSVAEETVSWDARVSEPPAPQSP